MPGLVDPTPPAGPDTVKLQSVAGMLRRPIPITRHSTQGARVNWSGRLSSEWPNPVFRATAACAAGMLFANQPPVTALPTAQDLVRSQFSCALACAQSLEGQSSGRPG
jgi:hypothetical protein